VEISEKQKQERKFVLAKLERDRIGAIREGRELFPHREGKLRPDP